MARFLLFALLIPALWVGISVMFSYLAGWPQLGARFRCSYPVPGEPFQLVSGIVGASAWSLVPFGRCLFLNVRDTGFGLSIHYMFRFLNPPLFIPWEQVESVTEQRYWFQRYAVVHLRNCTNTIMFTGQPGEAIIRRFTLFSSQHAL